MTHCTPEPTPRARPAPAAVLAVALLCLGSPCAARAAPRVVATVVPLHSLVAAVMEGVGEPALLVRGSASPHSYSLRPTDARLLGEAQVVFWVGASLESFLGRPLAALGAHARVVEVSRVPEVSMLAARAGGVWGEGDEHDRGAAAPPAGGGPASLDGHLWLDPANARGIARAAARELGLADPAHRARYAANAGRLVARLDALDAELAALLGPARGVPFVVFHDGYQYFERRYGLRALGSVSVHPEQAPGAKRVREVRARIRELGARCVFAEPQYPSALLPVLLEGTGARSGTLDPLGAGVPPGPDAYFALMRTLASSAAECLRAH